MASEFTIYEKPTCSTCRKANEMMAELGLDFDKVNYYIDHISEAKLRELIKKMQISPRQLLRAKDALYKELNLDASSHSDDDLIKLMVKHPDLIQRPIVERGSRAVLARPIENIKTILD